MYFQKNSRKQRSRVIRLLGGGGGGGGGEEQQAIYFSMGGWCGKFLNYMGH